MTLKNAKLVPLLLTLISFQTFADEYPSVKFGGYFMLDYDSFDANFVAASNPNDNEIDMRRVRLGVSSDLSKNWSAKFSVEASDDIKVKNAYIKFAGWAVADIIIGKQKEGFGMERLMSAKTLLMIERTLVTSAISPSQSYGVKLKGERKSIYWQVGYFQKDTAKKGNAVTGRLTWTPWQKNRNLVHLGIAFSERSLHGDSYRVNQRMEVSGADKIVKGNNIEAAKVSLTGVEFLWQNAGFVNLAEWQQSVVKAVDNTEYRYKGGYYQLSYNLSGKNRKYKAGVLGAIDKGNDWEATMRFSQMELLEENSEARSVSLGVNYYMQNNLKFMANVIKARYSSQGERLESGNAVSLRAQYHF